MYRDNNQRDMVAGKATTSKDDGDRQSPAAARGLLIMTFIATFGIMLAYASVRADLFPHITTWQSRIVGICMCATVATVMSHFAYRRHAGINAKYEQERRENERTAEALRRAHADLELQVEERTQDIGEINSFLRNIIDTTPNLISVKDLDGRFVLVNDAVAKMYGMTQDQLIGKREADFPTASADGDRASETSDPPLTKAECRHGRDLDSGFRIQPHDGDSAAYEELVVDIRGGKHWLHTVKRPLVDSNGESHVVLGISTEITHAKESEHRIRFLNAQLEENLQELSDAYDATIEGWARFLDLRDKETEGHSRRVTEMTLRLAVAMGVSDEKLLHIRRGALLHDIGKMGIPDAILLKPGALNAEEWEIMRRHPVYAYEMLLPIAFLHPALEIPYCHHEKWDGTGYPQELYGDSIPLAARMFAIVDVWDALSSDRPYRARWPYDKVLTHIDQLSGTHFDPDVVEAFREIIGEQATRPMLRKAA